MIYLFYVVHVIVCIFLILVVLLQQGKGADLSVFGGGGTQAAFGARGAATMLHRLTVWAFVAFIVTTMSIAYLQAGGRGGSVMSAVAERELAEKTGAAAPDEVAGEETQAQEEAQEEVLPEGLDVDAPEGEAAPAAEEPPAAEGGEPPPGL